MLAELRKAAIIYPAVGKCGKARKEQGNYFIVVKQGNYFIDTKSLGREL